MDRELVQPPPAALKPRLPLTPGVREPTQRRTHDHQPLTCQPKRGNLTALLGRPAAAAPTVAACSSAPSLLHTKWTDGRGWCSLARRPIEAPTPRRAEVRSRRAAKRTQRLCDPAPPA